MDLQHVTSLQRLGPLLLFFLQLAFGPSPVRLLPGPLGLEDSAGPRSGADGGGGKCAQPLGMEEGSIPDERITASSSHEKKSVGPQNARIRQEKNGGAWCPKAQISNDIREYLEVDLTQDHLITWTETQGRFGNGEGVEFAEAFFLEYWRGSTGRWQHYRNLKGDELLRGNSNTYLVERQKLDLPFVASRVRFVPYSQHPRTVCMRVEIYGCLWEPQLISYSIPAGEPLAFGGLNLEDSSYDGERFNRTGDNSAPGTPTLQLRSGLGQLSDGILGDANELFPTSRGTNWVGWSNRAQVGLLFEFRGPREFRNCTIHLANLPRREIEVLSAAQAWFSHDGEEFLAMNERLEFPGAEHYKVTSVSVTLPLNSKVARFVRLELYPRSKWLIVSEVAFDSVPIEPPKPPRTPAPTTWSESPAPEDSAPTDDSGLASLEPGSGRGVNGSMVPVSTTQQSHPAKPDVFPVGNSPAYIGLAGGALMILTLLLGCSVFLLKQRGRNKVALLQKHTALLCGPNAPGIGINMKDVKIPAPIVLGGKHHHHHHHHGLAGSGKTDGQLSRPDSPRILRTPSSKDAEPSEYEHCSVYEGAYKLFADEQLIYEPAGIKSERFSTCSGVTDFTSDHSFQDDKSTERLAPSTFSTSSKRPSHPPPPPSHQYLHHQQQQQQQNTCKASHEGYYAATDILTIKRREQQSTRSIFTPLEIQESGQLAQSARFSGLQRISRLRLRFLDKLGEGSFGLVYICEAKGLPGPEPGTIKNRQIVIVRSLWRDVTDALKKDFVKDMHLLAGMRDPNVARIIALVEEEPMGAVFEYGELGDLATFMKTGNEDSPNDLTLSYGCLLNFVTQIASGMKYLESLKIPHCDLAARNCIVNKNLVIKVSDHAMYCSKFDQEYYVNSCYAKIPLRWMAWEAVLMCNTSSHADVWSYAVTSWEIFSCCSEMPYAELTSEQVLENCNKWYQSPSGQAAPIVLPQPALCPRDFYRLMTKCWSRHAEDRPTFEEIAQFLKIHTFD